MTKPFACVGAALAILLSANRQQSTSADRAGDRSWPPIAREAKPWTRWWWHGSAVETDSLSTQLESLRAAGIGGVEITPIYGVRGAEDRSLPYLSDGWMRMLDHTLREAQRLDLGVDMATGTGWPFGGPWVDDEIAPRSIAHATWTVEGGARLTEPVHLQQTPLVRAVGAQIHVVNEGAPGDPPRGGAAQPPPRPGARRLQISDLVYPVVANHNLQALALEQVKYPRDLPLVTLMAYGEAGEVLDLTARVARDGTLDWTAPAGRWTLYAVFAGWHGKLVERAAPGGEGNVIDHFSREAIRRYLARFDDAFARRTLAGLRAFFNDSYEVDDATGQADWTPRLFEEFRRRRGYDLRRHLPALFGRGSDDTSARVLADYRETISDLLLETFTAEWGAWARGRKRLVRNQAHGSPASILDLYADSDIPETEGTEIPRFKWATSAAHVAGRRLVSAEAATWLGEHFRSTLAEVRAAVDRFFVAGVNHIVYHGTAYSPVREPWPGWLFYASVAFSPQNAWWDDFAALNAYVSRVQSFMQTGRPDSDVLLYYPLYDDLAVRGGGLLRHFGGANPPAQRTAFDEAARTLQDAGFAVDFVSDRQLRATRIERGRLVTGGGTLYRVVAIPSSRYVSLESFEHVLALAKSGGTVVSLGGWPSDVTGLADLDARRARFERARAAVRFSPPDAEGISEARVGRGRIVRGNAAARALARAGVTPEPMIQHGLNFARRVDALGRVYFISNPGKRAIDGWVPLQVDAPAVVLFDPLSGRSGTALLRQQVSGGREVYLQIPAGGSLIAAASPAASSATFASYRTSGERLPIGGPWTLEFVKGGPMLPPRRTIDRLSSWTTFGNDEERFSGTAVYTTTFARPRGTADAWQIDLGAVRESARVRLNGSDLATLIGPPYTMVVDDPRLMPRNVLEVSVTNLSANRIRDLDRREVPWKKFYNVNFPARLPQSRGQDGLFTAAGWEPLESGLIGPVTLTPLGLVR